MHISNPISLRKINSVRAFKVYNYLQSSTGLLNKDNEGICTILLCLTVLYDGITKFELAEFTGLTPTNIVWIMNSLVSKNVVSYDPNLTLGRHQRANLGCGVYKITPQFEKLVQSTPNNFSETALRTFTLVMNNVNYHLQTISSYCCSGPKKFDAVLNLLKPVLGIPVDKEFRDNLKSIGYIKYCTNSKLPKLNKRAYLADWSNTYVTH
jgi:hypothetical protein